jgi:hypothetical protein
MGSLAGSSPESPSYRSLNVKSSGASRGAASKNFFDTGQPNVRQAFRLINDLSRSTVELRNGSDPWKTFLSASVKGGLHD